MSRDIMVSMPVPSTEELEEMLLHQRIRKTRDGLPMTQQKFALAVEVSERQVKRWESATSVPTEENGRRIAELAGRPPELFIPPAEDHVRLPADVLSEMVDRLEELQEAVAGLVGTQIDSADRELRALEQIAELHTRLGRIEAQLEEPGSDDGRTGTDS